MGFLNDFLPVLKKHKLSFIEKRLEVGNIMTFFFKSDEVINWKAGQHGIFTLPNKLEGGSWRGFSIASYSDEKTVMISTRIFDKPSAFKKALVGLKRGDQLTMRGPFGPFYLDDSKRPVIFIAGGIGITPYRSLIKYSAIDNSQAPSSIRLLYSDDNAEYAYKNEFDKVVSENSFVRVDYITSLILDEKITASVNDFGNTAFYYVSGPPKMVNSIKKTLIAKGIAKKNIKSDVFLGL